MINKKDTHCLVLDLLEVTKLYSLSIPYILPGNIGIMGKVKPMTKTLKVTLKVTDLELFNNTMRKIIEDSEKEERTDTERGIERHCSCGARLLDWSKKCLVCSRERT